MRKIKLINSRKKAKVDDEDYDWLNQWQWHLTPDGFVGRWEEIGSDKILVLMHDQVMEKMLAKLN